MDFKCLNWMVWCEKLHELSGKCLDANTDDQCFGPAFDFLCTVEWSWLVGAEICWLAIVCKNGLASKVWYWNVWKIESLKFEKWSCN